MNTVFVSIKKHAKQAKSWISSTSNSMKSKISKYKKNIIIIFSILSAIILTVCLVMFSFGGIGITDQANIINYTELRISQKNYFNQVTLIGLNSILFTVPKRKFLIYFDDSSSSNSPYWSPKITARSSQGSKLIISARVSCQLKPTKLKSFLEQYGLNWKIYAIEKSKNVIIQTIAYLNFYQMNNQVILQKVNAQFSTSQIPFKFTLIGVRLEYPVGSFSSNNNLGIQLLAKNSLLSQLKANYQSLNNKMSLPVNEIITLSNQLGNLYTDLFYIQSNPSTLTASTWNSSLQALKTTFTDPTKNPSSLDKDNLRRYLWLYFQKLYNSTYNNFTKF